MKFFLDTADVGEIREGMAMGMVDGVTTNPSLVAKTGKPYAKVIEEICSIVSGPVSAETNSEDAEGMMAEARELAAISPQVNVKIPMTMEGLKAVAAASKANIRTNVTLIFQPLQGLMAAKAGASYVSPFVGRLDDIAHDGMDMVADLKQILRNYNYATEVIVASIRGPLHIQQAALVGVDIATIPFKVLANLAKHPLTNSGIEQFLADHKKIPKG
ncbi:MAG: fructose-6-phosphate aldolase [Deltaproteobacteria bacterium]|nr:fructose-6-phosphate aldolase [Deltaproteobacteria bacterium]